MGLIQDLQGRELTGCGGCDAVRNSLYKGMDWWAGSKHDSFNASSLGAFSETPLGARGDEGGPTPTVEKVYLGSLQDNPDDSWSSNFRVAGDITSRYPLAASSYSMTFGTMGNEDLTAITFSGTSFDRGVGCGGVGPVGFTDFALPALSGSTPGALIDITTFEGADVVDFWPDAVLCRTEMPGPLIIYRFNDPTL